LFSPWCNWKIAELALSNIHLIFNDEDDDREDQSLPLLETDP